MLVWVVAFAASTAMAAAVFVFLAMTWMRKMRETLSAALTDVASQQLKTAQRLGESIGQLQKQQRTYEQQLHNLAQAGMRMRQDIANVTHRLEHTDHQHDARDRTVH